MSDSGTFWTCEAARSGRSSCADCKEKIDKDDIRIGVTFDVKGHDYQMTKEIDCFEQWRHLYDCFNPSRHPSFDVSELIFEDQTIKDDICSFIEARATSAPPSAKQVAAKQKRKARDSDNEDSDEEIVAADVDKASSLPAKARQSPKKKSKAIVVEAPKKKGPAKKQKNTQSKEQEANAAALADVMRASARSARDERQARRDTPAHVVEAS